MSYQVLARKWRPKCFEELVGQSHVVTVLVNALTQQRLHHAYLFTGTRGVGKTTIARIFAKSLNCDKGITAEPCGVCHACQDIDQGRFVDLLEIDAASKTKVDDTREILDNVQYAPSRGRYKVYLIDEVHMLSRSSFNALLKTLEEPPAHVKFILATTDPQKLPVTVLSRCLQFHLKALTITQIKTKLADILSKEKIQFDDDALVMLAKAARGSMRDCLSLADQSIAQSHGHIMREHVQQMLGGVDRDWVYKILMSLIKNDSTALMDLSLEIASYAPSYSGIMAELIQLLHQIAMTQMVGTSFNHAPEQLKLLKYFSQTLSPEDIQLFYQIVINARKDLPYVDDEQAAFDMLLLRLLAFKPITNAEQLAPDEQLVPTEQLAPAEQQGVSNQQLNNHREAAQPSQQKLTEEMLAIEQQAVQLQSPLSAAETSQTVVSKTVTDSHRNTKRAEISDATATMEQSSAGAEIERKDLAQIEAETNVPIQPEVQTEHLAQHAPQDQLLNTQLSSVISTRNMLRSRKKQLEDNEKKSSDARLRQTLKTTDVASDITSQQQNNEDQDAAIKNNISTDKTLAAPTEAYCESVIDPSVVTKANQVDKWAHMIDSMELTARLRQLAIHATIDPASTDDSLILNLDQSIKHLTSDTAHKQLQQRLSEHLQRQIHVELNIVDKTIDDPYQIQSEINAKRYQYAKQLIENDDMVITFKDKFQATVDESTIKAL